MAERFSTENRVTGGGPGARSFRCEYLAFSVGCLRYLFLALFELSGVVLRRSRVLWVQRGDDPMDQVVVGVGCSMGWNQAVMRLLRKSRCQKE